MNIYWEEHDNTGEEVDLSKIKIATPPKPEEPVGGYDVTGNGGGPWSVMFMMRKKPNWFHRQMSRILLGWVWVDKMNN